MYLYQRSDRVLRPTRWLAAIVVPFLVAAFVILYLLPGETGRFFAWPIQPAMSSMMLAAAYGGGIHFFLNVLFRRQWHHVKAGFLPVTAFAAILGVTTILHWDRFTTDSLAFILWALLYFTTPFLVVGAWLGNRHTDPRGRDTLDARLPPPLRLVLGVIGGALLLISSLLFFNPTYMIASWPWTLSPLTARVLSALFALPALVSLGVAADARWSAARIIMQSQSISILFILLAAWLSRADIDWGNPWAAVFVVGLLLVVVGNGLLYLRMERAAGR
jgi:hypothetical protein